MENKLDEIKKALESFSFDKIEKKEEEKKDIEISIDSIDWNSILSNSLSSGNTISTAASQSSPWVSINTGGTGAIGSGGGGGAGSNGAAGSYSYSFGGGGGGTSSLNWNSTQPSLQVTGDAEFAGDIKWKGQSLGELLKTINDRLAILVPDPEKLAHFEALKKAHDHYKTLEALCQLPNKKEK